MSNLSYEYRRNRYTLDLLFGDENDYNNYERGDYWKRRLKGCMLAAIGYALGIPKYEDIIEANSEYMGGSETYEKQMAILFSKATRIPKLVFEVGSGRGELAAALTAFDIPCIASDFMPDFEKGLRKTDALWGAKVNGMCVDIIEASHIMRKVKPDTVILCETIEHIPREEFMEAWVNIVDVLREMGGLFIVTNWLSYHPLPTNNNEHIWEINDDVYDWLSSYAKKTVYRKGSHLVLQF